MDKLVERIAELCEAKGWTQYRLSVESGISQSTIATWFRDGDGKEILPGVHSLQKLANALGVTVPELFRESEMAEGETISVTLTQARVLRAMEKFSNGEQVLILGMLEGMEK